jgi:outer membrane protein OmpA-like peptidoglycan-associated protein
MKQSLDAAGRVALYVTFDTDKAAIKPESGPLIAEIVKLLKGSPELSVYVDGHTDDVGTPARNRVLAQDRARSVVAALTAAGIDPGRLTARGFGSDKPLAPNADEDGRAKNRRVELVKR